MRKNKDNVAALTAQIEKALSGLTGTVNALVEASERLRHEAANADEEATRLAQRAAHARLEADAAVRSADKIAGLLS